MGPFLDGRSTDQKIEDAKKLLQEHGYLVRGPLLSKNDVRTPTQLVQFFYDTLAKHRPQMSMVYAGSLKKDRAIAKRLIESRMALGVSRARAVAECCEFIVTLFRYENRLALSFPVTSMSVFGQESMGWLTEKVWQIYEGINNTIEEEADQAWFERFYAKQEKSISDERLIEARDRMDRIRERYGKED